jgi:hypothetical protein
MLRRMHGRSGRLPRTIAAAAAILIAAASFAVAGPEATASTPTAPPASAPATTTSTPFCPPAAPGQRTCLGRALKAAARARARAALARAHVIGGPAGGYAPQDIQSAYNLAATVGTNGLGLTVAIVDAYSDPRAIQDLAAYRSHFGLPACPFGVAAASCLRIVNQTGGQASPAPDAGWADEITLDLDAVSTSCPLCHILLVEASSQLDSDLITAVHRAATLGASVMSLSFGGCEVGGQGDFDTTLRNAGIPIAVASGDGGYQSSDNNPFLCPVSSPEYPASSPQVTAVGGTTLNTAVGARGWAESAWSYSPPGSGGGSGCSSFEVKPAWQTDAGCAFRTVADVSADADPNTGLAVYNTYSDNGWDVYGGTSLAAPLVAGIYALADAPAAAVDGRIWYTGVRTTDVTSGTTAPHPTDCSQALYLCNAGPGYDGPTGMGTPNGLPMFDATMTPLPSPYPTTAVPLSWSPPPGIVASRYQVWERDDTAGTGPWLAYTTTPAWSTTFYGFRGHSYDFAVQYFMANGSTNGPPVARAASTTVSATATTAMPYTGMYAVDGYGTLHPASSPQLPSATWLGWDIVRGMVSSSDGEGGLVLDGWGGLHPFGDEQAATNTGYWAGWDIADGIATSSAATSGYVLDRWGGLHPFEVGGAVMPLPANGNAYWPGWNIARSVAMFPDGTGGVVLDAFGGVHPFAAGANPQPPAAMTSGYWPGWDIARSLVVLPTSTSAAYRGYVLDAYGGMHPFSSAGTSPPPAIATPYYAPGLDSARAVVMVPGSGTAGYVVDGWGGFHAFGSAQAAASPNYGADGSLVRGAGAA